MRTLYLRAEPGYLGREGLHGRALVDAFRKISDEFLLGWAALDDEPAKALPSEVRFDYILPEQFARLQPDLIFIEGGMFTGIAEHPWKLPADCLSKAGPSPVVILEASKAELWNHREQYKAARAFLGAGPRTTESDHVYGVQALKEGGHSSTVVCRPQDMAHVDDALRAAYNGVSAVAVNQPVELDSSRLVIASADPETCGTLASDSWVDIRSGFIWASALALPRRTVAVLGGSVAADWLLEFAPDNTRWLTAVATALLDLQRSETGRLSSRLRSDTRLFLSHRTVDKPLVREVQTALHSGGIDTWLDEDRISLGTSISNALDAGLAGATHFVLFWSASCIDAPWVNRELGVAVNAFVERGLAILIVRLDAAPLPAIVSDLLRIEANGLSADDIAKRLASAVTRL